MSSHNLSGCNDHLGQGGCPWRAPPCKRGGGPEFALIMVEPHDRDPIPCGLIPHTNEKARAAPAAPDPAPPYVIRRQIAHHIVLS